MHLVYQQKLLFSQQAIFGFHLPFRKICSHFPTMSPSTPCIQNIPIEVWRLIFQYLEGWRDILALPLVCRLFKEVFTPQIQRTSILPCILNSNSALEIIDGKMPCIVPPEMSARQMTEALISFAIHNNEDATHMLGLQATYCEGESRDGYVLQRRRRAQRLTIHDPGCYHSSRHRFPTTQYSCHRLDA